MAILTQANLSTKEVLTLREACKFTGLSESTFYKMSSNHKISFSKPQGKLFFKRTDLEAFMLSNYMPSKEDLSDNVGNYFNNRN